MRENSCGVSLATFKHKPRRRNATLFVCFFMGIVVKSICDWIRNSNLGQTFVVRLLLRAVCKSVQNTKGLKVARFKGGQLRPFKSEQIIYIDRMMMPISHSLPGDLRGFDRTLTEHSLHKKAPPSLPKPSVWAAYSSMFYHLDLTTTQNRTSDSEEAGPVPEEKHVLSAVGWLILSEILSSGYHLQERMQKTGLHYVGATPKPCVLTPASAPLLSINQGTFL